MSTVLYKYTKKMFIDDMAYAGEMSLAEAKLAYNTFVAVLGTKLGEGETIHLEDVGTFKVSFMAARGKERVFKHATTGEDIVLIPRSTHVVRFAAANRLKRVLKELKKV